MTVHAAVGNLCSKPGASILKKAEQWAGNLLLIGIGLVLLVGGAQLLVRGASKLAVALGIPPLIVGLTIVAFGTSAPELAVSIQSCLAGKTGLVLGNVVGSNIYNVLFILGLCAVIAPLGVAPQLTRFDVPVMILASVALLVCAWSGQIARWEGALLFLGIVAYTVYVVRQSLRQPLDVPAEGSSPADAAPPADAPGRPWWFHVLFLLAGLGLLGYGSDLLVGGAVAIAERLNVSPSLIGMTVVTLGTTAPELSACLVAAFRGERDIAVGNIVGSNIFNILSVLGIGAVVAPSGIEVSREMASFALPVMVATAFACLPIFFCRIGHPPLGGCALPPLLRRLHDPHDPGRIAGPPSGHTAERDDLLCGPADRAGSRRQRVHGDPRAEAAPPQGKHAGVTARPSARRLREIRVEITPRLGTVFCVERAAQQRAFRCVAVAQ